MATCFSEKCLVMLFSKFWKDFQEFLKLKKGMILLHSLSFRSVLTRIDNFQHTLTNSVSIATKNILKLQIQVAKRRSLCRLVVCHYVQYYFTYTLFLRPLSLDTFGSKSFSKSTKYYKYALAITLNIIDLIYLQPGLLPSEMIYENRKHLENPRYGLINKTQI